MNPILLSFLCGAAFIGGAAATTCMVALAVQLKDKKGRREIAAYWQDSLVKHDKQLLLLERMVMAMENAKDQATANPKH